MYNYIYKKISSPQYYSKRMIIKTNDYFTPGPASYSPDQSKVFKSSPYFTMAKKFKEP